MGYLPNISCKYLYQFLTDFYFAYGVFCYAKVLFFLNFHVIKFTSLFYCFFLLFVSIVSIVSFCNRKVFSLLSYRRIHKCFYLVLLWFNSLDWTVCSIWNLSMWNRYSCVFFHLVIEDVKVTLTLFSKKSLFSPSYLKCYLYYIY